MAHLLKPHRKLRLLKPRLLNQHQPGVPRNPRSRLTERHNHPTPTVAHHPRGNRPVVPPRPLRPMPLRHLPHPRNGIRHRMPVALLQLPRLLRLTIARALALPKA